VCFFIFTVATFSSWRVSYTCFVHLRSLIPRSFQMSMPLYLIISCLTHSALFYVHSPVFNKFFRTNTRLHLQAPHRLKPSDSAPVFQYAVHPPLISWPQYWVMIQRCLFVIHDIIFHFLHCCIIKSETLSEQSVISHCLPFVCYYRIMFRPRCW
jgi:hypothetical protein